jgi:hypothetical protein
VTKVEIIPESENGRFSRYLLNLGTNLGSGELPKIISTNSSSLGVAMGAAEGST